MDSIKNLLPLVAFIINFELLKVAAIITAIITLPFRLFRKRPAPSTPTFHPKVSINIHNPEHTTSGTPETIVLIHGYPDSSSLWDATVSKLTECGYRCVTVDLPGSKGEQIPRFVYPSEMVASIVAALEPVSDNPFTLVAHDWGSFYGLLVRKAHPRLIHRVVLLDVGELGFDSDIPWMHWACIFSYQSTFALMFMIGEPCKHLIRYTLSGFPYRARPMEEVTVDMFYYYASILGSMTRRLLGQQVKKTPATRNNENIPVVPMLYVYGAKKRFNFHDSSFLERVRASPRGEVVAFPCGHWIMIDLPDEWTTLLTDWLKKSRKDIPSES